MLTNAIFSKDSKETMHYNVQKKIPAIAARQALHQKCERPRVIKKFQSINFQRLQQNRRCKLKRGDKKEKDFLGKERARNLKKKKEKRGNPGSYLTRENGKKGKSARSGEKKKKIRFRGKYSARKIRTLKNQGFFPDDGAKNALKRVLEKEEEKEI